MVTPTVSRRSMLGAGVTAGFGAVAGAAPSAAAAVDPKEPIKIAKIETFYVCPRSVFVKISTNVGIVGWGEPCLEGKSETVAAEVHDLARYLVGQDARQIVRHWDRMYKGLYRGGSVRVSAISGIDHALWDIFGKALGLPVWQLLGGPVRDRVRVYWDPMAEDPPELLMKKVREEGYTAVKGSGFSWSGVKTKRPSGALRGTPATLQADLAGFLEMKEAVGPNVDVIYHGGGVDYRQNMYMIKALEPHNLLFYEIHANNHNFDDMAEIQRKTFIPIATGEDAYTRWEFRDILVKDAARVLMADLTHAGGITETRNIAAMAEAFERTISPHNAQGVINFAAAMHIGATTPNFLAIETTDRGIGDPGMKGWEGSWRGVDLVKEPFKVVDGHVAIPTKPGLGIEIDEEGLKRHTTDQPWLLR
jgi:galactonate dehydratase